MLAAITILGCYAIPPRIPQGYVGSPAREGWPPHAVYELDPFHPRNRWFHRQWSGRTIEGRIVQARADEPMSLLRSPSRVDVAELLAILVALEAEPVRELAAQDTRQRISDALFRGDLAREAARVRAEWPPGAWRDDTARRLEALASRGPSLNLDDEREPWLVPPPLRTGKWETASQPDANGLLPSAVDARSTRVVRRTEPEPGTALERGIASECWLLEPGKKVNSRRVYRFDRAEWLHGREPWRLVPEEAEIAIRSPLDPTQGLRGSLVQVCSSCHCGSLSEPQ